ncbi:MAG: PepSY-associated TM helix domain-containing protein [Bacteroidales bacterium]
MNVKWRKWNRYLHRDMGYFFFGMTFIYALSGIAINHVDDWNPNYEITRREVSIQLTEDATGNDVKAMLEEFGEAKHYKKHFFPQKGQIKVFLDRGSLEADLASGYGVIEKIRRRPVLHQVNYLHYNPVKWWTWFSDLYAVALIFLAFSGLFILRGKQGITGRGAWLTILGILIPLIFLWIYY